MNGKFSAALIRVFQGTLLCSNQLSELQSQLTSRASEGLGQIEIFNHMLLASHSRGRKAFMISETAAIWMSVPFECALRQLFWWIVYVANECIHCHTHWFGFENGWRPRQTSTKPELQKVLNLLFSGILFRSQFTQRFPCPPRLAQNKFIVLSCVVGVRLQRKLTERSEQHEAAWGRSPALGVGWAAISNSTRGYRLL